MNVRAMSSRLAMGLLLVFLNFCVVAETNAQNTQPPTILSLSFPPDSTVTRLISVRVTFSEPVTNINAADLLINGSPATAMSGTSGTSTNFVFIFSEPPFGLVQFRWAPNHGITDVGSPALAFDDTAPGATWDYTLQDTRPPTLVTRFPSHNTTLMTLTEARVGFSENVQGVEAADFLINGVPAASVQGTGSNYTFNFPQPIGGPIAFTWRNSHGITDLADPPNPFDHTTNTVVWNILLDTRTTLINSNSTWRFLKGTAEASSPVSAWRQFAFDDGGWSNAPAPFFYGDPYDTGLSASTLLTDMAGGYSSIYLRHRFEMSGANIVSNLYLNYQIDDGIIVWVNGTEVFRSTVPGGPGTQVPFNGVATGNVQEGGGGFGGGNGGARVLSVTLGGGTSYLREGDNVIAVHALNSAIDNNDFGFNLQLYAYLPGSELVPPRISNITPAGGELFYLTNLTVRFNEPVSGVNASDLLINGVPAASVTSSTNTTYTFAFAQPLFGAVSVTWAANHGIADLDNPPRNFDHTASAARPNFNLVNPSAPTVVSQTPSADGTITEFTQINVLFNEPVANVNASDLLINGVPATSVTGSGASYNFSFAQPAYGEVAITWAANHGITDVEAGYAFDATRAGNFWSYTLVDRTPPRVTSINPIPGSQVTNLTQIVVTFSEALAGVDAGDLLINGNPAASVIAAGASYTFNFPQPNATVLNFSWANTHGIHDLAPVPNAFSPGEPWTYTTPDTLAPAIAQVDPPQLITVKSLNQIRVVFTEPVAGVHAADLLINGRAALSVSGSGEGPYTFSFLPSSNGVVNVTWAANHGITDLAAPMPNSFAPEVWSYIIDPNADFAGKVIISEIMFNSLTGLPAHEWIELRNISSQTINLTGWRFSRGINFTFPHSSIPAGGYLVVAANLSSFATNYPNVTNVVGGWRGSLANSDENVELQSALGEIVNTVHYATQGDWARRERANGADLVERITRNGSTATVRIFGHGFTSGGGGGGGGGNADVVMISGADQPEYNGTFTISGASGTSFNITVPGSPVSPATGVIIARRVADDNVAGWSWFTPADGYGHSVELVNANKTNEEGQNWLPSISRGGTPGNANSVAAENTAPLLLDVKHTPVVPRSTDPVTITARIQDENSVTNVRLFWRNHTSTSPGQFSAATMSDNGSSGDGLAGDGLFGAILPAQPNGTVIEFYVHATDSEGLIRTWPAPTWSTNGTFSQLANALYMVDNEVLTEEMPSIRLVLTGSERAIFPPGSRNSDALMNNTFIATDGNGAEVRYLSGVRVRGAGSRSRTPPNNRVNIPNDKRWNGLAAVNLNAHFVHAQLMGSALAQKAGVPASPAHVLQYRINGVNPSPIAAPVNGSGNGAGYGAYVMVMPVNGDLAEELWPEDGDGNVYRASTGNHSAQFVYRTNPDQFLADGYFKTSNGTENDWSDMMRLTYAFSQAQSSTEYFAAMSTNVNVDLWMRYFALGTLLNYGETSLFNGRGDDYAMYRGVVDPRFIPIGHDFDTVLGQGDSIDQGGGAYPLRTNASIFIMMNPPNTGGGGFGGNAPNINALRRFMTNEEFAPIFFREVKHLAETIFAPDEINPMLEQLLAWPNGPTLSTIEMMKTHAQNRRYSALSQIPLTLTVSTALATNSGMLYTTNAIVTFYGQSHAIETRQVLVNGSPSIRSPWEARWTNAVTLRPGINRVVVQSMNNRNEEFERQELQVWFNDSTVSTVSGAITTDTIWNPAQGPYQVSSTITVNSGATLTILPGTTVYLAQNAGITVANGGRLLAEGTDTARIRFTRVPGGGNWTGIIINGAVGSPQTRITYAHIEGNNSTAIDVNTGDLFLSHTSFGSADRRYLDLDGASFVIEDCHFPNATTALEPIHGSIGIRSDGRGIIQRCFVGRARGYNDSIDFTGGNRPGPILQILNNVFMGSDDDILDLDSTDAWIEGNIFLHTHRNGSPDSASAISGGADNADTSQITAVRNLFFDVDQAALAKQGNFYTFLNNTIVFQNLDGSQDPEGGVIIMADEGTAAGRGFYLEDNIIYQTEQLVRNLNGALVTFTNNVIHHLEGAQWTGPGGNNRYVDPLFRFLPNRAETMAFATWQDAQVMWEWLSLKPNSPAAGTGAGGADIGATKPAGIWLSGVPVGATSATNSTIYVHFNRAGNNIPTNGFPGGSGYTHYRWRLDGGAWSAETPLNLPIQLTALSRGQHFLEVIGKNDAGFYQDNALFGPDALITKTATWIVESSASPLRLNEILASNAGIVNHSGTTPDLIEIYNSSDATVNLAGVRLTDDSANPDKFIFPAGTSIPAKGYLVLYANNNDGTPGLHLGFNLSQMGETLYMFKSAAEGGNLIDSVTFGFQLDNLSIGRKADGSWTLAHPTFGSANKAAELGDSRGLQINEWLANAQTPFPWDFVEIYNPENLPVNLGGLYLTDNILGNPTRQQLAPLSFVGPNGYVVFISDSLEANRLDFGLTTDQGLIALINTDLTVIDSVVYQPQRPGISQGRNPNGGSGIVFLDTPTPGAPNPIVSGPPPFGGVLVINEILASNNAVPEPDGRTPDWIELYNGTGNSIDLGNFSLTDTTVVPRRFIFPAGTEIPAGGYLRILSDSARPAGTNNTGFGLSAGGGAIFLFDKPTSGGGLVNSLTYGIQVPNLSIGRVPSGSTNWVLTTPTPNAQNAGVPQLAPAAALKVNEWMADPVEGDDWFEIHNPTTLPISIGGLHLTDNLNDTRKFQIPALSFIGTDVNGYIQFVADGNSAAGADHVSFSLRAAGEALAIASTNGTIIDAVEFGQQNPGVSEGRFPDAAASIIAFPGTTSPEASNWRRLSNIFINEILANTEEPFEDAIELFNASSTAVDVGGWWLSDDTGLLRKFQIPSGTIISPSGYLVIYQAQFTNSELAAIPFAVSAGGDEIVLSAAAGESLTGFRASVDFGASSPGLSMGRYLTSDGRHEFVPMSSRTFGVDNPNTVTQFRTGTGRTNSYPLVGPIVISEIMYHPPDLGTNDNTRDEFIELRNISSFPTPLFDGTNTWRLRNAVDFDFPVGTSIAAEGTLLVVGFDPVNNASALAEFRARYQLSHEQHIVGPWLGRLANDSDDVELRRPETSDTNGVQYVLVERVRYFDVTPWPAAADGSGQSLHRISNTAFGNDPINWVAATPTPGPVSSSTDMDADGMQDDWELLYSLDPTNPGDAQLDTDNDGLSNLQEFLTGTSPLDPASVLQLETFGITGLPRNATMTFFAPSNVTLVIEHAASLNSPWQPVQTVTPALTNRTLEFTMPVTNNTGFYRLRSP